MATLTTSTQSQHRVSDGTRTMDAVAVLGKDGSNFQPAMDTAQRPGYMVPCDGANAISLVNSANLPVAPQAVTSGGATPYKYIAAAAADQDATVVKASAGTLYSLHVLSTITSVRYVKIYDTSTAPTSADTPVLVFAVPATAGLAVDVSLPPCGALFSNGIAFRITTGVADSNASAATASDCVISLTYK